MYFSIIRYLLIIFLFNTTLYAYQKNIDLKNPAGWRLSGGEGKWQNDSLTGEACLTVTGSGKEGDSNYWYFDYPFQPKQIYKISCLARTSPKAIGGHVLLGSNFFNRATWAGKDWEKKEIIFTAPSQMNRAYLRFGQWQVEGTVWFKNIQVNRVQAIYTQSDGYQLDSGERLEDGLYFADLNFQGSATNASRTLWDHQAYFNTSRWDMYQGDFVVYRHLLKPGMLDQKNGKVSIYIGYYTGGTGIIEASRDGKTWRHIGSIRDKGFREFDVPTILYPAAEIYIRIRITGLLARIQVHSYRYQVQVPITIPQFVGHTDYIDVLQQQDDVAVQLESFGSNEKPTTVIQLKNQSAQNRTYDIILESSDKSEKKRISLAAGTTQKVELSIAQPIDVSAPRRIIIKQPGAKQSTFVAQAEIKMPYLRWSNYGNLIGKFDGITLWWTDGTHKISRERPPPLTPRKSSIEFFAAKNEYEPMQLVLQPDYDLKNVSVSVTSLQNIQGDVIPLKNVQLFLVEYVFISHPTDAIGTVGHWPDPLPPIDGTFSIQKGQNQPLWILIKVPENVRSGDYVGSVKLKTNRWQQEVPLHLHVWDFTLPKKNHLQSSFGFDFSAVRKYHHLSNRDNLNAVLDHYFISFADHRISPVNPFLLQDIKTTFDKNSLQARLDFRKFDLAAKKYFDEFGFNSFCAPIQGLASGDFFTQRLGSIDEFKQGSPQYQKLMTSYLRQIQDHFEQMGLLDKAYVQIIDEPTEAEYGFLKENMKLIHQAAPKLTRMVTEQPVPELYGYIDLWCPITYMYDHETAEQRRAEGEHFWWYICTSPKSPYCTLFIDHHAVELRTWIWQAWKYGMDGILIWQTNYWNSETAYPRPNMQNPYKDPMSYKTGYGLKVGEKEHWGNGDGRFLYPPKAVYKTNSPCHEGPVSSIRWEILREGMEDYEYFWLLRNLIDEASKRKKSAALVKEAKELLIVPDAVTKSLTEFSKIPEPIYEHRAKIAEMIERLQGKL